MPKWRVRVAVKEWLKMTSGYEYPAKGVEIMYITVDAEDFRDARDQAANRLVLMELEGHVEDAEEVPVVA